ncbi:MAG: DUF4954 family protein [Phycisphaerae bacterium]|nr:DUF4954 family protein [Phycisphaerae bacterium]
MDNISLMPEGCIGRGFLPAEYIPEGKDEYYLRNAQLETSAGQHRHLRRGEVKLLIKNGNACDNWDNILVTDEFDPGQIKNTEFFGFVRIGRMRRVVLEHHDLQIPAGISDSRIIACDIGDDVAIHNVRYLAHYIIGDRCILLDIDEMHATNHAKFGNGIIKDGESENIRVWLDLMNEAGGRRVMPFDGMIPADAYIWAKYRDDGLLQKKLGQITQKSFDSRRGFYGTIGQQCIIKCSRILKDVKIGSHCYIKGINKLKNLTINSSESEPTQIGEGVEMVNGIVGFGCHIFYGCKAVRFIMGNNSNLKYGARLLNSFLGDNSTVSCCEILNNLIFPAHEQHHNNSFLIAGLVMGQSNLAAGATIGSNHNSRSNDNELQAGRGFWPGLCANVKHSCRFASYVLLSKGSYPAEMDIPLPFSLLNNNTSDNSLEVMPAFWWLHNMYALARNTWKFQNRDKRKTKVQNVEFDSLAPDTAEEILNARYMLEVWVGKAVLRKNGEQIKNRQEAELAKIGRQLLSESEDKVSQLEVLGERMEKSKRKVVILCAFKGYHAYGQMLHYYALKNLLQYLKSNPEATFESMSKALAGNRQNKWTNLGGQLAPTPDVDLIRADIGSGKLDSWQKIHSRYDALWDKYPLDKQKHAFAILCEISGSDCVTSRQWLSALDKAVQIQEFIRDQVYITLKKDFDNPYRQMTYRNMDEMTAVIGTVDDNSFVKQVKGETETFRKIVEEVKKRK